MPISVVDFYRDFLPKTNCGDCSRLTCMAFAAAVIIEKYPAEKCPHIDPEKVDNLRKVLNEQYASGKYVKKDNAQEALLWARERAASMKIEDLPDRIGGSPVKLGNENCLRLPYFNDYLIITSDRIIREDGKEPDRLEQVFVYNHIAQGGKSVPAGNWKGFQEFPNTVSKIKSMIEHVEKPIESRFNGKIEELKFAAGKLGARDITGEIESSDLSLEFLPLPRIPLRLIFRDGIDEDGIGADVKLLFDATIIEHLDIESIMFLCERLRDLLCGTGD